MAAIEPVAFADFRSGSATSWVDPRSGDYVVNGTTVRKGLQGRRHQMWLFPTVINSAGGGDYWDAPFTPVMVAATTTNADYVVGLTVSDNRISFVGPGGAPANFEDIIVHTWV